MKVILAIKDFEERKNIENAFNVVSVVDEVVTTTDIYSAIERMKKEAINTAVFDLEMFKSNLMGTLSAIREMKTINADSQIILIANGDDDVMTSAAFRFGINYVVVRPYDVNSIVDRVMDLNVEGVIINEELENKNKVIYIERMTSSILNGTGILPNLKGYKYLKEAIVMGYSNNEVLDAVTKFLYPQIAKKNNTTSDRVERAIRHAIESAWNKCGGNGFYTKMGFTSLYGNKRPTNSEYIFAVVEYLNNHSLY